MGSEVIVIPAIFIGLPWLILHYITKWKTSATLTNHDEKSLGDLHEMARYFEDRLETIERIIAAERADPLARSETRPESRDELSERRTPRQIAQETRLSDADAPISYSKEPSLSKERNR